MLFPQYCHILLITFGVSLNIQIKGYLMISGGYRGLQWFQLKPPLKIARPPNLLTSRRVGDNIATSYQ